MVRTSLLHQGLQVLRFGQRLLPLAGTALLVLAGLNAQAQTAVFSENFEGTTNGFTLVNGSEPNKWFVGTVAGNGPTTAGTRAAYISNSPTGATHNYDGDNNSVTHMYRDVTFPAGQGTALLNFDWLANGESTYDFLLVQSAPTTFTPVAGTVPATGANGVVLLDQINQQLTFTRNSYVVTGVAGTTVRFIFTWVNDDIIDNQPPAVIDNVVVTAQPTVPISGTFTINNLQPTGGTNFTSFTDAATALNLNGINGPTTFNVLNGPYTEQFMLSNVPGTSATSRLVVNGNGRTIRFGSNNANQRAVVMLNRTDFVTLDSLTVDATGGTTPGTYGWGIELVNGANDNIIRGCTVTSSTSSTSTNFAGIVSSASTTSATGSGSNANQNVTIVRNTVTGGYYGITNVGNTTASPSPGGIIRNNRVRDFYLYGIYNLYQDGPQIIGNDASRPTRTTVSTFYGIYLSTGTRGARVEKNRVHQAFSAAATSTSAAYGIYLGTTTAATAALPNYVINNLVYDLDGNGTVYGIYNGSSSNARYYNNAVNLDDQANTSTNATYGFYHTTGLGVEFKNNIVRITRSGTGLKYALYFSSATGNNIQSNYNDLYGTGTSFNTGYYLTAYATLANWRTANGGAYDANSLAVDPVFVSATSGNLQPSNVLLNNAGQPLTQVTDDITGATRNNPPDIGAYEFTPTATDVAPVSLVGPGAGQSCYGAAEPVIVQIRNGGTAALNFATNAATVTVVVTLPGGTKQTFTTTVNTGTLASGATQNITLPGTLNMTALGSYSFAVTATAVGDANTSNDVLSPSPVRAVIAPTAGTLSPSSTSICVSGTASLSLANFANGSIQYQSATSATGTFTDIMGATSAAYTTPVLTSTTYYRAKVSCNGREVFSNVSTITVNNPVILTAPVATTCAGGTAQLLATAGGGGTVRYYSSATGGTALTSSTMGGPFTTPALTTTTTYYAASVAGAQENVGKPSTDGANGTFGGTAGLLFTATGPTTITSVTVYTAANFAGGQLSVSLTTGTSTLIQTYGPFTIPANMTGAIAPTVVPVGVLVPGAGSYRLVQATTLPLVRDFDTTPQPVTAFPYTSPSGVITITDATIAGYYYFFYNWQIGSECAGSRTPLTVTVTPGLVATLPQGAATICGATPYTLNGAIAGTATGLTYTSTGTGTFSPNATTLNATYTPSPADIAAGTVTITATPTGPPAACTSTGTVVLTIQTPPNASFSYPAPTNPSTTYCLGSGTVAPVLAAGATAGTFSTTGVGLRIDPVTGVINLATSSQPGTFTIVNTVAGTGVCNNFTSTATITLNFGAPAPGTPVATAQANGTVVLSVANPLLSVTYQFYRNGVAVGAATAAGTLTLTGNNQSGSYTVVAITAQGCQSAPSTAVTATVTGTRATAGGLSLQVASNPTADGHLNVRVAGLSTAAPLVVLNALGQVVQTGTAGATSAEVDLSGVAAGVYVLRVSTPQGVLTERIVRQ